MKNNFVTDTMALILILEKRKINPKVKNIFQEAEKGNVQIIIPAMVLAEIGYLSEKKRIECNLKSARQYYSNYNSIIVESMTDEIIEKTFAIKDIPELHDRIIAGTALSKKIKLITNDPIISSSKFIEVIW